jgi:hypothetical protein
MTAPTRVLGALSLLSVGAVHLHLYDGLYSSIPTIGTLFLLNFIGATALGLALLAPLERFGGRLGRFATTLSAIAGIGLAATAFVFLFVSERTPLFGFEEPGYDPAAMTAARASEVATVLFLGAYLYLHRGARSHDPTHLSLRRARGDARPRRLRWRRLEHEHERP